MEKPILFNTEMVRAILDGRKTQTRRAVKEFVGEEILSVCAPDGTEIGKYGRDGWRGKLPDRHDGNTYCVEAKPPCKVGDILWVRETWNADWCDYYIYKADGGSAVAAGYRKEPRWRPSIHMPRKAARIFLKVKDVRAERLFDSFFKDGASILSVQKEGIDIGDTCRECIENYGRPCCVDATEGTECIMLDDPRTAFSYLWESTIIPANRDLYGWHANPWVWVIEFERCEKPEGWC